VGPVPYPVHPVTGFHLETESPSVDFYETGDCGGREPRRGGGKMSDVDKSTDGGLAGIQVRAESVHSGHLHEKDEVGR